MGRGPKAAKQLKEFRMQLLLPEKLNSEAYKSLCTDRNTVRRLFQATSVIFANITHHPSFLLFTKIMTAVLAGRHIGKFLKLPHEMKLIFIPAKLCNGLDGHFRGPQVKTGGFQACLNHILNAGNTKQLPVKMLQIGRADMH